MRKAAQNIAKEYDYEQEYENDSRLTYNQAQSYCFVTVVFHSNLDIRMIWQNDNGYYALEINYDTQKISRVWADDVKDPSTSLLNLAVLINTLERELDR